MRSLINLGCLPGEGISQISMDAFSLISSFPHRKCSLAMSLSRATCDRQAREIIDTTTRNSDCVLFCGLYGRINYGEILCVCGPFFIFYC